jgi:hypothetical protein
MDNHQIRFFCRIHGFEKGIQTGGYRQSRARDHGRFQKIPAIHIFPSS